jgi:hypothetical protein
MWKTRNTADDQKYLTNTSEWYSYFNQEYVWFKEKVKFRNQTLGDFAAEYCHVYNLGVTQNWI